MCIFLRFTECSRVCGGGIRKSTRECNNPLPSETGELCLGESVMYESCNTHECSPGTPNFRAQQCARLNNDTTHWVPFISEFEVFSLLGKIKYESQIRCINQE